MEQSPSIRRGQVYWLDDCEPLDDDNEKRRPVVVIAVYPTIVVAVTTQFRSTEVDAVKLPNQQENERTTSGLPRPCWAVPRWFLPVDAERLRELAGYISGPTLRRLTDAVLARMKAALE